MADTSVQHKAEAWVIEHGLPKLFPANSFAGKKLKLTWGGSFAFDAVSNDGTIVAAISTSAARTATGKLATAKFQKLKTDALYLLHLETDARRVHNISVLLNRREKSVPKLVVTRGITRKNICGVRRKNDDVAVA